MLVSAVTTARAMVDARFGVCTCFPGFIGSDCSIEHRAPQVNGSLERSIILIGGAGITTVDVSLSVGTLVDALSNPGTFATATVNQVPQGGIFAGIESDATGLTLSFQAPVGGVPLNVGTQLRPFVVTFANAIGSVVVTINIQIVSPELCHVTLVDDNPTYPAEALGSDEWVARGGLQASTLLFSGNTTAPAQRVQVWMTDTQNVRREFAPVYPDTETGVFSQTVSLFQHEGPHTPLAFGCQMYGFRLDNEADVDGRVRVTNIGVAPSGLSVSGEPDTTLVAGFEVTNTGSHPWEGLTATWPSNTEPDEMANMTVTFNKTSLAPGDSTTGVLATPLHQQRQGLPHFDFARLWYVGTVQIRAP